MGGKTPTAIVCDDAPGFRVLLSALLDDLGIDVTGQAGTWAEAEHMVAEGADVVVVDLWMPQFEEEALARIRAMVPDATLAVVTALGPEDAAAKVSGAGVDLLLSKSAPPAEVAAAIAAHARERVSFQTP